MSNNGESILLNFLHGKGKVQLIKEDYSRSKERERNFKSIRRMYDLRPKTEYTLDDQSFEDLDLNSVYKKIDKTYTSAGESSLYGLLRNLSVDENELNKREKLINFFKDNETERIKLQIPYFNMGFDTKDSFIDMIQTYLKINKWKYYLYTFLGKILIPLSLILTLIMREPIYILSFFILLWINGSINMFEGKNVKDKGLLYLRKLIVVAKKISHFNIDELKDYQNSIAHILDSIKVIDKGTRIFGLSYRFQGIFELISVPLLLEEAAYYKLSSELKDKKNLILDLYYLVGEIEAFISISSYKTSINTICTKPKFLKETSLSISEGIHPLVENAIPNSINIDKHGIILTGTNMSGKSTFLRMLGINIVFAQTFNFVLAQSYEACFFNVVSSISPKDDVEQGKSYYLSEAESILRIIKATEKPVAVFSAIDEIFRGTNPIERISASAEILKYINSKGAISIVATHDRELANILKDNYDFFYFSESVDSNDGLSFDYKLKKGVSKTKNAIKLLNYLGYPEDIVENSYKRAKSIEGFI